MSRRQLADKMDTQSISVWGWENDRNHPRDLAKLVRRIGISKDELWRLIMGDE